MQKAIVPPRLETEIQLKAMMQEMRMQGMMVFRGPILSASMFGNYLAIISARAIFNGVAGERTCTDQTSEERSNIQEDNEVPIEICARSWHDSLLFGEDLDVEVGNVKPGHQEECGYCGDHEGRLAESRAVDYGSRRGAREAFAHGGDGQG